MKTIKKPPEHVGCVVFSVIHPAQTVGLAIIYDHPLPGGDHLDSVSYGGLTARNSPYFLLEAFILYQNTPLSSLYFGFVSPGGEALCA